jgi:hypothetical protein
VQKEIAIKSKSKIKTKIMKDTFKVVDLDDMKLKQEHIKNVEPVGAVYMKKGNISKSNVGDTIVLPVSDDISYDIKIVKKINNNDGSVSLTGIYEDAGTKYHAIFTEAESVSFVSVTTPNGVHEFDITNEEGYVYKSSDINNARIDYSKPDTIEK